MADTRNAEERKVKKSVRMFGQIKISSYICRPKKEKKGRRDEGTKGRGDVEIKRKDKSVLF